MNREILKKAITESYLEGRVSLDSFQKSMKRMAHLIPKKVQVRGKNGKIFQAIRWVDPDTGKAPTIQSRAKVQDVGQVNDENIIEKINNILISNESRLGKVRNIINLGIYDTAILSLLTGIDTGGVRHVFQQEGINYKTDLPQENIEATGKVKDIIRKVQENITPETRASEAIIREYSVDELWDAYRINLSRVINNRHKFCLAYGSGGVGKTYEFEQMAEKMQLREYDEEIQPNKDQYDYIVIKGKISPTQVYAEMYRHRDKLLVFDDCDSFLSTEDVQGFLKAGLDTGKNTKISYKSRSKIYNIEGDPDSGTIPSTFQFKGRVIAITNLSSQQIDQAVRSRGLSSNLTMTINETVEKLENILHHIDIYTADKSAIIDVNDEARKLAFETLVEEKEKLNHDINTRVLSNAILIAQDGIDMGFEKDQTKRQIKMFFDSVTGEFDKIMRSKK